MKQNIISLENMLDSQELENSGKLTSIKPKYQLNQWIDVKNSNGDWLEGQIIEIFSDKVKIHYNGRDDNLDEFFDIDSDRIKLFRSETIQHPSALFSSPFPELQPKNSLTENSEKFDENLILNYCIFFIIRSLISKNK